MSAMTDVMDDVDYAKRNFNQNYSVDRHPMWMTDSHFVYHLCHNERGQLICYKNKNGDAVCSPRYLIQLCLCRLVRDPQEMRHLSTGSQIPTNLYPTVLMEAIFQRELHAITYLVSSWPLSLLNVYNCLPLEEYIDPGYLTGPTEGAGSMSFLDSIMLGILNLRPESKLRVVDFTGFQTDRKLCRDLSRLPILWMKYSARRVIRVHEILSQTIDISLDKAQRYLNRIGCIYSSMDMYIKHGNKIDPSVTILWDCKVTLDDVPIGLGLQFHSPFRFACKKLWSQPITEITVPIRLYPKLLDPRIITHLEIEDEELCADLTKFDSLQEGLLLLPNLTALSLPNTIHVNVHENAAYELHMTLKSIPNLRKLNFSSCNLKDSLALLLDDLDLRLSYLNLRDCRLNETDLQFLVHWSSVDQLLELNLSRNNFKTLPVLCIALLHKLRNLTCFSISYCSLGAIALQQIVRKCVDCEFLKVLCIQSFTPPPVSEIRVALETCADIPSLQRCALLPEVYAFLGGDDYTRHINRVRLSTLCTHILINQDRADIEIE